MEKILGNISFFGAISIVFIGVLTIIVRANPTEQSVASAKTMEEIMLVILAISGITTFRCLPTSVKDSSHYWCDRKFNSGKSQID